MKKLLGLFLLLTTLYSCDISNKETQTVDSTKLDTTNYAVGCKPVEAPAEKKNINARMLAVEPNFWDPNYRSYRVCTLYVEVAYNIYVNEGYNASNAEAVMRNYINLCSEASQRVDGVKYVVGNMFIHTTPDPYVNVRDAVSGLYLFGQNSIPRPQAFQIFISDANIGGCAYISPGAVTSAKFAFITIAKTRPTNSIEKNFALLIFNHEMHHILGLSHSHNDCAWKDKNGNRLGPLDSCYSCENNKACPPTTKCVGTTKRMPGDFMSYCHIWGTAEVMLKAPELAVLHKSLYYSSLPTYTPTTIPCTTVYSSWSTCNNGVQTRSYTQTGNCTTPPTDSLTRVCTVPTVIPVTNQVTYKGTDGKWRVKFNIPINQTTYPTYTLNVCRYTSTCLTLQACAPRTFTPLTATEKSTGIVDRILNAQPSPGNPGTYCYRTSITANNVTYWTPSYTVVIN